MYETMSISTGLYPNLDLWNANKLHYITLKGQIIIGFIKKQRLNWLGHVERMAKDNNVQKIKRWKPVSKRPTGRPKTHWGFDVLEDIRSMNVRNWKKVHRIETVGRRPLSNPEPYVGCSDL